MDASARAPGSFPQSPASATGRRRVVLQLPPSVSQLSGKTLFQKMMALMSPGSSKSLPVSQMNYFGVGAKMLWSMMKEKNVNSLEEMISLARELGVRMIACEMSRDLMGIKESELVAGLECGGVASFLADSLKSRTNLFI
jgi:peroxiredoxin family protein